MSLTSPKPTKRRAHKGCTYNNILFRSSYEASIAKELDKAGLHWEYEPDKFEYVLPVKVYVPDFKIHMKDESVYLEVKGYLDGPSRVALRSIKKQYPDLPLSINFMKNNKLSSKTKYTDWTNKYGYPTTVGLDELWLGIHIC